MMREDTQMRLFQAIMKRGTIGMVVVLMVIAGCASRPTYRAKPTPRPHAAAMPVWHIADAVAVGVDPYVQLDRQQAVFDAVLHKRGVLPLQVVIQNRRDQPLHLRERNITLEFPDGSQRYPLAAASVAYMVAGGPTKVTPGAEGEPLNLTPTANEGPLNLTLPANKETAYATVGLMALGLAFLPNDIAKKDARHRAWEARVADYQAKAFQDTTLALDEATHGFVFFTSPAARGFHEATLILRVDTGTVPGVVVRVPLSGLGHSQGGG